MKHTEKECEMARKILERHVPNHYPPKNGWIDAMLEYGDYIKNNVALVNGWVYVKYLTTKLK